MRYSTILGVFLLLLAVATAQTVRPNGQFENVLYGRDSTIVLYVMGGLEIVVGIYLIMFGFRLWKITSGISGFLVGFFVVYFFTLYFWPATNNIVFIAVGSGVAAGVLVGLLLFLFPLIALFGVSVIVGFCLGVLLYNVALVYTGWPYAFFISIGVCALVLLIIACCVKKPFIIIITSFYGAISLAFGITTFLPPGSFPIYVDPRDPVTNPGWVVYAVLGAVICVTLLGVIMQGCLFAKGITWDQVRRKVCPSRRDDRYMDADELGTPLMETGRK